MRHARQRFDQCSSDCTCPTRTLLQTLRLKSTAGNPSAWRITTPSRAPPRADGSACALAHEVAHLANRPERPAEQYRHYRDGALPSVVRHDVFAVEEHVRLRHLPRMVLPHHRQPLPRRGRGHAARIDFALVQERIAAVQRECADTSISEWRTRESHSSTVRGTPLQASQQVFAVALYDDLYIFANRMESGYLLRDIGQSRSWWRGGRLRRGASVPDSVQLPAIGIDYFTVRVPERPRLYHITHGANLSAIVETGGLLADSEAAEGRAPTRIGMSEVVARRKHLPVPCHPNTCGGRSVERRPEAPEAGGVSAASIPPLVAGREARRDERKRGGTGIRDRRWLSQPPCRSTPRVVLLGMEPER